MIKPTVGRIVWYHPGPNNSPVRLDNQPFAAIVTGVIDDRTVNLTVFDADGYPWPMRGIKLAQDDDRPEQYMAEWMPYQIGQAKKYEEGAAPVLDARLEKIESDNVELDRRMKLLEARPQAVDISGPGGSVPLKPGTPNFEAQRAQNDAKREQEFNSMKVTTEGPIAGQVPEKSKKAEGPEKKSP